MAFQSKWGQAPLGGVPQAGPGLQEQALKWGANKALTAGINAAIPGGGIAAEGAKQFLPGVLGLASGGYAPGGGRAGWDYGKGWQGNNPGAGAGRPITGYSLYGSDGPSTKEEIEAFYRDTYGGAIPEGGLTQNQLKDLADEGELDPIYGEAPAPAAAPAPTPQEAQKGGFGVDFDIGLGQLGGWDLGTKGSYKNTQGGAGGDIELTGTRGFDVNRLFGAAPLSKGQSSSKGGTPFVEREMGSAISGLPPHLQQAAQQQAAPAPAPSNPLQPYLDAGIDPQQAQMLLDAGAPPPSQLANGGKVDAPKPKGKKGWWQSAYDYAMGTGRSGDDAAKFLSGKGLPEYKNMGGMIPSYSAGPLGMKDMVSMSKDIGTGPLAGVKYKKQGGEIVDEVEVKFHGPQKPSSPAK